MISSHVHVTTSLLNLRLYSISNLYVHVTNYDCHGYHCRHLAAIGTNTVSASFSKLKDAEIKLKEIVKQKLTNAVYDKDRKEVDRFV